MKCLWPSTIVAGTLRFAASVVVSLSMGAMLAWCTVPSPSLAANRESLADTEKLLRRAPAHISEFAPMSATALAVPKCGEVRPPEALLTPDPLLQVQDDDADANSNSNVRVSFIVGTDGHVHSAFVLESGGRDEDQAVLSAVQFWRYRPALCNGVPTDSEALVRFTIR